MQALDAARAVATNHRWTWHRQTADLLATLPGAGNGEHPLTLLDALDPGEAETWADGHGEALRSLAAELAAATEAAPTPTVAYLSPEFGIAAEIPQYSGGLGILAGDHLKSAADLGLPLIAVGLLYRGGFFRQDVVDGRQQERYETLDPSDLGAVDTGLEVEVPVADRAVVARVFRQDVGTVTLLLLDTDRPANTNADRAITDRLYSGDRRHRLDQELVLGVGGIRALRAFGVEPQVVHLNEGHACFGLLELLATEIEAGRTLDEAVASVRARTLFTTHTPVPAGIDRFERDLIEGDLEPWADRLGVDVDTIFDWAHLPSDPDPAPFNTAALAFELSGRANGVSQLHAEVSRELFATLPRAATVVGITNGVHARTWVAPAIQELYDGALGPGWENGDPGAWARVDGLDADAFAAVRATGRREVATLVADRTGLALDPELCLIGFARRFATYKRAALLLEDRDGLLAALDAGARLVFAGKAHPADGEGKAVLAELADFAASPEGRGRLILVPDYDIDVARTLYAGCDVWLNTPIRPHEASGTSGEKAALNGGLNLSILDGWWADWYTDGIGWAIPASAASDPATRDRDEARAVNGLLVDEVLPRFDAPDRWWAMTTAMLAHLGPRVTAGRMVAEYDRRFYTPIAEGDSGLIAEGDSGPMADGAGPRGAGA